MPLKHCLGLFAFHYDPLLENDLFMHKLEYGYLEENRNLIILNHGDEEAC